MYNYILYYRFIVRFPIGIDFLFITLFLHFFRSWTSSLSISSSVMSTSTRPNHVLLGCPTGLLPSTLYSIHFIIHYHLSSSLFLITWPYHLNLPPLMTVVIGWTPINFLSSSLFLLYFKETPLIDIITCIYTLLNFNPTSVSKGLVSFYKSCYFLHN